MEDGRTIDRRGFLRIATGSVGLAAAGGAQAGAVYAAPPTSAVLTPDRSKAIGAGGQPGGTLVFTSPNRPDSLDPSLHVNVFTGMINAQTHEPLLRNPAPNVHVPWLATAWESSSDFRTFTFHLRSGVRFHDGTPLTADAVKFTWERILDPATATQQAISFAGTRAIETSGEDVVRITFTDPNPSFLASVSTTGLAPESPAAIKRMGQAHIMQPVGTGAFIVDGWPDETTLVLRRNPDYHWPPSFMARTTALLDRIVYRFVKDEATRTFAVRRREVHIADDPARDEIAQYTEDPALEAVLFRTGAMPTQWLFNHRTFPTADVNVRRAFLHAVDRQRVVDVGWYGTVTPATGPLQDNAWAYWPATKAYYPYDPHRAAMILDGAGYRMNPSTGIREKDGRPLRIRFITYGTDVSALVSDGPSWNRTNQLVQQMVKAVGIDLDVEEMPQREALKRYQADEAEMARLNVWGNDPDLLWAVYHSSQIAGGAQWNRGRVSDPKLDALLDQLRRLPPSALAERRRLAVEAQRWLMDDAVAVFLVESNYLYVKLACVNAWAFEANTSAYYFQNAWLGGDCRRIGA